MPAVFARTGENFHVFSNKAMGLSVTNLKDIEFIQIFFQGQPECRPQVVVGLLV